MQGVEEGEGVIFAINEAKCEMDIVNDQKLIDKVVDAYEKLCEENPNDSSDSSDNK